MTDDELRRLGCGVETDENGEEWITLPPGPYSEWAIEAAINRRLAQKLGCQAEEVDLRLPQGDNDPIQ